jgi:hypothetical protein
VNQPKDRLETGLNLGCGAVAGFTIGIVGALGSSDEWLQVLAVGLGVAVLCALGALRFGQRFWDKLIQLLSWIGR